MIDTLVERVETLDVGEELALLARHAQVGNPTALDRLALAHAAAPAEEARRIAVMQLRVLEGFASQLRWLEALTVDTDVDAGVRAGLAGLLIRVCAESELPELVDSQAAVLLEPALLLHGLLANLRPWLPSFMPEFESDAEFEVLRLGVPDYMLLVLRDRFENLWTLFHRLRQSTWLVRPESLAEMPSDLELFEQDPRFCGMVIPTPPTWPPMAELVPTLARAVGSR
ncbi:hypothetical protein ACNOYE_20105 [Nannocystaceae bacterium ST9]